MAERRASKRRGQWLMVALGLLLGARGPMTAADTPGLKAVPAESAQADAQKLIRDLYREEYAKRKPGDQAQLARKLVEEARKSGDDAAGQFMLLREARDLAASAGELVLACETIDALAKLFAIDPLAEKSEILQRLARGSSAPAAFKEIAETALLLIGEAARKEDFPRALELAQCAEAAAGRAGMPALRKQIEARTAQVREVEQARSAIGPALKTLESTPQDPAASAQVGAYHCFARDDWARGLPLLAQSEHPRFAPLAKQELVKPAAVPELLALADGWWALAEDERGLRQFHLQRHAAALYRQIQPQLNGLTLARVEKRLQSLGGALDSVASDPSGAIVEIQQLRGHVGRGLRLALTPDGRRLLCCGLDKTARVWDLASGRMLTVFEGHAKSVHGLAISPDGKLAATGGEDNLVRVWNIETGQELYRLEGHAGWVVGLVFSGDGKRLYSGSTDRTIRVWNLETKREVGRLVGHANNVHRLALSPDRRTLASTGHDNVIRLWNVATGRPLAVLLGHSDFTLELAIAPDGRKLYSGGQDRTIRVWDLASGKELRRFEGGRAMALSPDGKRLLTSGLDKSLILYDTASGKEVARLKGAGDELWSIIFLNDARRAATVGEDGVVRVWRLPA